jgi:DNA-binding transcriptional regulator YhcF (GntR family)
VRADIVKWARAQPTIGPCEYAVLLAIALEADRFGTCLRSIREIAQEVTTDPSTVRRALERLRARGLLSWDRGSGRMANTYRLPLPR